jgi:hypothetical protein
MPASDDEVSVLSLDIRTMVRCESVYNELAQGLLKARNHLFIILLVLSGVAHASAEQDATKIFYGGFAFAGSAGDIEKNYPIACSLDAMAGAKTHFFEPRVRDFFRKNTEAFKSFALQFGIARPEDTPLVMALALTDEKILREQLGDMHKLVVQIGLELLVLDFSAMEVVSSRPICIELIDAGKVPYTDDDVRDRMRTMVEGENSQLFEALRNKLAGVSARGKNQCTLQIKTVTVGEKAYPFLPEAYRKTTAVYGQTVAQQFGSLLTSQAGVALLPYSKDGLNSKMSLRFVDASMLQFKIPAPTFAVDVNVKGFKKVLDKSTEAESLWIYGAFLDIRVYEPDFNHVFYEHTVKYGVTKIVPASQKTVDEFPVVSEALKGAILTAIEQMQNDKSTNEKVLLKCKL